MRGTRTGVVLLTAVAMAGCGSGGELGGGLTSGQRAGLLQQLEAARSAAAAGNVAGTESALDHFRRSVIHLRRTGSLTDAEARSLRIGAGRVLARVKSDNPPPAPVTTTTQVTPAPAPPPAKDKHGKGHGKGDKKHGEEGKD